MIVVTGAAGFIASCLVTKLIQEGYLDIVVVDNFTDEPKLKNLGSKNVKYYVPREEFMSWLKENYSNVDFIFHLGARTDTTEFNWNVLEELNLNYTKEVWKCCCEYDIPLIYASSAATYGAGENGYIDDESIIPRLKPLNPYGESKNEFDIWALRQPVKPKYWVGLKFFNVYGPNEYHKKRMASVVLHAFNQIKEKGEVKLFKSHISSYQNGQQLRDFVYVKDVISVCMHFFLNRSDNTISGIYNLGSGKARTFVDLTEAIFKALNRNIKIEFVDMPIDIRDKYQYFTQADTKKIVEIGKYKQPFTPLEVGVSDYVLNYLINQKYF